MWNFTWKGAYVHAAPILKSGKAIANVEHHTFPTALVKARRLLDDEYLEDIDWFQVLFLKREVLPQFQEKRPSS